MDRTARFSGKQLAESQTYRESRDLLLAVLEKDSMYTRKEAEAAMEAYRRKQSVGKEK